MSTLKHRAHVLAITPGYVGGKRDHFNQFIRNGRWGACADCPTAETERLTFPELCANTSRSDHHLTLDDLTEGYKRELVHMEEKLARREASMEAVLGHQRDAHAHAMLVETKKGYSATIIAEEKKS